MLPITRLERLTAELVAGHGGDDAALTTHELITLQQAWERLVLGVRRYDRFLERHGYNSLLNAVDGWDDEFREGVARFGQSIRPLG